MSCVRCNIFGHKMREVKNIDTNKMSMICFRCGYREDTRIDDILNLLYSLQQKVLKS